MIFATLPVLEAENTLLAHTLRAGGETYKKGTVLSVSDLKTISAAGVETVCVARLDVGDVREDEVAVRVAEALAGVGIGVSLPLAGRCNLHAEVAGVLDIRRDAIDTLNGTGDGVLCATIEPFTVVAPGRTLATLKVIPYAVPEDRCNAMIQAIQSNTLQVHRFRAKTVSVILTEVPSLKPGLLDKARESIVARVETYASRIVHEARTAHSESELASAIETASQCADIILVLGGASTADVADTVPSAIHKAGGTVDLFGVPLDPGNLLVMGRIGDVPVLGLPGCARSPKMNGIDLILPRIFAEMPMDRQTLLGFGVGGLLHDVDERPQPREPHSSPITPDGKMQVAAVILAAGSSRRMGRENKLLQHINNQPMVRSVVETALASQAGPVIVVTGHDAAEVRQCLTGLDVTFVHNPNYEDGLSTSVRIGVGHVDNTSMGAIMMLGDMPCISSDTVDLLIETFQSRKGQDICVPVHGGQRGNPILWPREFFPDMMDLSGDAGARRLLKSHQNRVAEVDVGVDSIFIDVDTSTDLKMI